MQITSRFRYSLVRIGSLPMFLTRSMPRGDGGVPDDKDKENKNLTSLLQRHQGDAMALATQLLGENADLRGERRTLKTEVATAQGKGLKEGQVAVSAEDAQLLAAYKPLGTPEELKTIKGEHGTLKKENETLTGKVTSMEGEKAKTDHLNLLGEIADEVEPGVKWSKSVLARLDQLTPNLSFERRDVSENGKTFKRTFVKFKDGEGETAPIKEMSAVQFAAENTQWKDFLPALQAQGATDGSQSGTDFVKQGSGGNNAGRNFYDQIRKQAEDAAKTTTTSGKTVEERMNMRS